VKVWIYFSH